ncbi:hypothetical protein M378DRAFT_164818 [Amanita muscaria Koide BX008]|uniref:Uncharacterized protein n=1 Tax=Amanita muscaria (strain Koide BX008) TaxID=946122 RepID=A0A0C2WNE9_AMAMK|nr:hypothetical protein M378DRAFT_164818 [Amanita muscaria Koide BX008]
MNAAHCASTSDRESTSSDDTGLSAVRLSALQMPPLLLHNIMSHYIPSSYPARNVAVLQKDTNAVPATAVVAEPPSPLSQEVKADNTQQQPKTAEVVIVSTVSGPCGYRDGLGELLNPFLMRPQALRRIEERRLILTATPPRDRLLFPT